MSGEDVKVARRALAELECDEGRGRNRLVWDVVQRAAIGEDEVLELAQVLADDIRTMGVVTALELLAVIGWRLLEVADRDGGEVCIAG